MSTRIAPSTSATLRLLVGGLNRPEAIPAYRIDIDGNGVANAADALSLMHRLIRGY